MPIDKSLLDEIDSAATEAAESLHAKEEDTNNDADGDSGDGENGGEVDSDSGEGGAVSPEDGGEGESREEPEVEESGEESGEESDEETPPEPPVKPSISDDVLSEAILAGIPIQDAKAFESDESLRRVISVVKQAAGEVEEPEEDVDPLAEFPELDPEEYDEKVIAALNLMRSAIKAQHETIKEFRSAQSESHRAAQQAAAREVEQWFDGQIAGLGKDFAEALGNGSYSTLERGSSQLAKRDAIANQMAVMLAGYAQTGQQAPPREEVFSAAARLVLQNEFESVRERKLAKDLEKRAGQHISRAGGKHTKTSKSPLDETAELIDRKYFGK